MPVEDQIHSYNRQYFLLKDEMKLFCHEVILVNSCWTFFLVFLNPLFNNSFWNLAQY